MTEQQTDFTAEESAALKEMQAPEPVETRQEPVQEQVQQPQAPEFKTTREKPEETKPPEGFVPHQAMHAERMKRQELEKQVQELLAWKEAQAKPADAPPQFVDPLEDPAGYRRWAEHNQKQLQDQIEALKTGDKTKTELAQKMDRVGRYEAEFTATTPDYMDATKFLHNARLTELTGEGMTQEQALQQISKDIHAIVDAAEAIGMNPARLAYIRAQEAGWKKPEAAPVDEAAKIEAIAAAQAATQGLPAGGGQPGKLTAAQLANMSEDEIAKLSEADIRAAMGG